MKKIKQKYTRRFLGNASITASPLEKKHLKAYLKGKKRFRYGYEIIKDKATGFERKVPKWHDVKEELTLLPMEIEGYDEENKTMDEE